MNEPTGTRGGCPVVDFDFNAPRPVLDYFKVFGEMRERAPIFWNSYGGGFWMLLSQETVRDAFRDPTVFSSEATIPTVPEPDWHWIPTMENFVELRGVHIRHVAGVREYHEPRRGDLVCEQLRHPESQCGRVRGRLRASGRYIVEPTDRRRIQGWVGVALQQLPTGVLVDHVGPVGPRPSGASGSGEDRVGQRPDLGLP
jgi:hypothetical protein